jgi:hypothetical protein
VRSITSRILVLALLLFASPAIAQQRDLWVEYDGPRRIEVAVTGGAFMSSDWSDLVVLETLNFNGAIQRQVLLRDFSMRPEFGGTASITYWRGRHGFRVFGGFVESCLSTFNDDCDETVTPTQIGLPATEIEMNTFVYGVQGIVGLTEYSRNQWFRPYLVVGGGGITYDLDRPLSTVLPGPITSIGPATIINADQTIVVGQPTTLLLSIDEVSFETQFALNLGVGIDLRAPVGPGGLVIRLEASDQITRSPLGLRVVSLDNDDFNGCVIAGCFRNDAGFDEVDFDSRVVHNWRLSAGLAFEFGIGGPNTVTRGF